jgi:hypothetical protein
VAEACWSRGGIQYVIWWKTLPLNHRTVSWFATQLVPREPEGRSGECSAAGALCARKVKAPEPGAKMLHLATQTTRRPSWTDLPERIGTSFKIKIPEQGILLLRASPRTGTHSIEPCAFNTAAINTDVAQSTWRTK